MEIMARYNRDEAREWARENLVGVVNCTIPSFTGDLKAINEKAIRHDARLAIEHGFAGTLGVSEVAITLPEYLDFLRLIKDEAGDRLILVHHASFSTLEQNIEAVIGAEEAGAELVLLSYPPRRPHPAGTGHADPAVGHQRPRVLRPHDPPRVQPAARRQVRRCR
jgi:4-hydroxy-tetrahydrodipicolinate synthase